MGIQDDMFRLISEWKDSGSTRADFLKDKKISKDKFSYWISKYNKFAAKKPGRKPRVKTEFKKIDLPGIFQEQNSVKLMEFTTSSGIQIIVYK